MMLNPLEETVINFIGTREKPFNLDQLFDYINKQGDVSGRISDERLVQVLNRSGLVCSRDNETFHPRRFYFKKAKFLIFPQQEEIQEGILIPGHRFLPFYNLELFPWECSLIFSGGFKVGRKKVKKKIKDLLIYYSLFGVVDLQIILCEDEEKNFKSFESGNPKARVEITVFEMKNLYREFDFNYGDYFLATVENWDEGIFSLQYMPASKMKKDSGEVKKWIKMLENGFIKAFDWLGPIPILTDVIAHAFFFADREVTKNPRLHLGGFFSRSDRVGLTEAGSNTYLWKKGESVEEAIFFDSYWNGPRGDTDSLEAILSDTAISLHTSEIEAYMRDELFSRGNNFNHVVERILKGREVAFYDEIQQNAFFKYLRELWKEVKENYNIFSDSNGGKLRNKALKILDEHLEWLRDLDAREIEPDELPSQKMMAMGQFIGALGALLNSLNYLENIPKQEYVKMDQLLNELGKNIHSLIKEAEDFLF